MPGGEAIARHIAALRQGTPREALLRALLTSPDMLFVAGAALPPMVNHDGFYALEQTALGAACWSGRRARKRLTVRDGRACIALFSNRPGEGGRVNHAFILMPWNGLKVPRSRESWREIELVVPDHLDLNTVTVEIVTFDHWLPAVEHGSTDPRCLGLLARWDDPPQSAPWQGDMTIDAGERERLAAFRAQSMDASQDW